MARAYHSPSSLELGDQCRHKWGLRYITGLRYVDQPWAPEAEYHANFVWPEWVNLDVILADKEKDKRGRTLAQRIIERQRSSAFGTAMHSIGEGWYLGTPVDWQSEPGKVFLSGAHLLPHPDRVQDVLIEQPIGDVPYTSAHLGETKLLHIGSGIHLMGYIDLEVLPTPEESARLGLPPGWVVCDYKSTKNLQWAKTPDDLLHDGQAASYAYAHAHSPRSIWACLGPIDLAFAPDPCPPQRWIYFQTQGKRQAMAVDARPTYRDASARVHLMVEQAKRLDTLETIDQCMANPSHCPEFGGCEFHVSKGGPCNAERRLGAAVNQVTKFQSSSKETHIMDATNPQGLNRFQLLAQQRRQQAGQAAPPPPVQQVQQPVVQQAPPPPPVQVQQVQQAPVGQGTNSFGAPTTQGAGGRPRAARGARAAAAAAPPPPPLAAAEAPVEASGPVFKLTIECSDPAELAALAEILSNALAQ